MVAVTSSGPRYGRCTECGNTHRLQGTRSAEVGEPFERDYCCGECLSEHGSTEHIRVHARQHSYEERLAECVQMDTEEVVMELLKPSTYSRALAEVQVLRARGREPERIWSMGRESGFHRIAEETEQVEQVELEEVL